MFSTPLIAAPMAGGTTTPELALAVQGAGAFAFAAGGYKTAEQLREHIAPLRASGLDFGVNLFVPHPAAQLRAREQEGALAAYRTALLATAARYGAELPDAVPSAEDPRVQDFWAEKIALLLADPVPVVSFTFGLAPAGVVEQLRKAGTRVLASVTSVSEALAAAATGVDALVVQHTNAGGHTAAFLPVPAAGGSSYPAGSCTLPQLIAAVRAAVEMPLVAAGGVSEAADAKAALAAGAQAVAIGTALIRTHESGARALHKDALADPAYTRTALTRAFTGKLARALENDFVRTFTQMAPEAYPEVHFLTAPLRAAAAAAADPQALNLWAGTGWKAAQAAPAADVVQAFLREL